MSDQPDVYMYLDAAGIESLFAQTVDRVETEFQQSIKKGLKGGASVKFGIGKGLAALLGLDAGAKLEAERTKTELGSAKLTLTVEHKLRRLLKYLLTSENLAVDLAGAVGILANTRASVFLKIHTTFDMPKMMKKGRGIETINEDGAALFETVGEGSYAKVAMAASVAKFCRAPKGRLGRISHESLYFERQNGRNVPLNVFGSLRGISASECQIKPYAIWT
jgi:hypothetical protein